MNIFDFIREQLTTNPVFAGVAGGSLLTGAIAFVGYQLRAIPALITRLVLSRYVLTLEVREDDQAFYPMSIWLARHPDAMKSRRFQLVTPNRNEAPRSIGEPEEKRSYELTPGMGRHLLRFKGKRFLLERGVEAQGSNSSTRPRELLKVQTFGRNPDVLKQMVNDIAEAAFEERKTVAIYQWEGGGFRHLTARTKRGMDTVYLAPGQRERIVSDLGRFLKQRQWYADRGIPWRRGYEFNGPPGTGKTTLIFALASLFDKSVYIISPSMVFSDGALQAAFSQAGDGFVVVEDADAFSVTRERPRKRREESYGQSARGLYDSAAYDDGQGQGVTLSGLLNAIDGIASEEGRILFVTSNQPETLDAALRRPGRLDVRETLERACADVAERMHARFFPEESAVAFIDSITHELPMAHAEIQGHLLALSESRGRDPVGDMQDELARRVA